jgi:hypothetical protein
MLQLTDLARTVNAERVRRLEAEAEARRLWRRVKKGPPARTRAG